MNNLTKRLWLYGYLNKKLEEIETSSRVFSNSEAYFIKAVNILYKINKEEAEYFTGKYFLKVSEKFIGG